MWIPCTLASLASKEAACCQAEQANSCKRQSGAGCKPAPTRCCARQGQGITSRYPPKGTVSSTTGGRNDHCSGIRLGGMGPASVALPCIMASAREENSCKQGGQGAAADRLSDAIQPGNCHLLTAQAVACQQLLRAGSVDDPVSTPMRAPSTLGVPQHSRLPAVTGLPASRWGLIPVLPAQQPSAQRHVPWPLPQAALPHRSTHTVSCIVMTGCSHLPECMHPECGDQRWCWPPHSAECCTPRWW